MTMRNNVAVIGQEDGLAMVRQSRVRRVFSDAGNFSAVRQFSLPVATSSPA